MFAVMIHSSILRQTYPSAEAAWATVPARAKMNNNSIDYYSVVEVAPLVRREITTTVWEKK